MINSQIETTAEINNLIKDIKYPITLSTLIQLRDLIYSKIKIHTYDDSTKEHEKSIRWKRTAAEIIKDGYVYSGKACTDLTVLFIALCRALGLDTNFVKVKKENSVHSVAEIKLDNGWYIFDVSNINNIPINGIITENTPYKDWQLWKKGRDAWDLGLSELKDIDKIF
ncbi:MAG: transglutaminase domain-containing protein [Candidatus Paceibacterota bacterium]